MGSGDIIPIKSTQTHRSVILLNFPDEDRCIDDLDAMKLLEVSLVRVSGDDVIRFSFQSTGKGLIVCRFVSNPVCPVGVPGDDSLSENKSEYPQDRFILWHKLLPDPGILNDLAELLEDLDRGDKNED